MTVVNQSRNQVTHSPLLCLHVSHDIHKLHMYKDKRKRSFLNPVWPSSGKFDLE